MRPKPPPNFLAGYPVALVTQIHQLIEQDKLGDVLLRKYPQAHAVRSDKALYDYVQEIKGDYLGGVGQLSRVAFDSKMQVIKQALGTHTSTWSRTTFSWSLTSGLTSATWR